MKKNIILIQSHCNNEEKIKVLNDNLDKLNQFDIDILLFSHISLPEEIIKKTDFFVYCNDNPIMWEERRHWYWKVENNIKYETIVPDYGWTVFNQIIKGFNFIENLEYEFVYVFCYDLIIDDVVIEFLTNPRNSIFIHKKPDTILGTALVFSVFDMNTFKKIVKSLSRKEYGDNWEMIAEKYFEEKLKELDLYEKPQYSISDSLHESKDIFNVSKNSSYFLFLDNEKYLKFKFFNKTNEVIKIIINDTIINVGYGEFIFMEPISEIETVGCIIGEVFDDWKKILTEKRINKMNYL